MPDTVTMIGCYYQGPAARTRTLTQFHLHVVALKEPLVPACRDREGSCTSSTGSYGSDTFTVCMITGKWSSDTTKFRPCRSTRKPGVTSNQRHHRYGLGGTAFRSMTETKQPLAVLPEIGRRKGASRQAPDIILYNFYLREQKSLHQFRNMIWYRQR
ncbi:unnamed protein product [Amoebophrya sp. A25]|nr:unnamed protein product [Amoebophrya sp. A25]|eukprot:GSA25T00013560001.1